MPKVQSHRCICFDTKGMLKLVAVDLCGTERMLVFVVVNHLHIRFGWLIEPEVILGRD